MCRHALGTFGVSVSSDTGASCPVARVGLIQARSSDALQGCHRRRNVGAERLGLATVHELEPQRSNDPFEARKRTTETSYTPNVHSIHEWDNLNDTLRQKKV